jgi:hypothetical protein
MFTPPVGAPPPNWVGNIGYGPVLSDPRTSGAWVWSPSTWNVQVGNNDEFQGQFITPAAGTWSYTYRFSNDSGATWTYCDISGNGTNPGLSFDVNDLGVMISTP